MEDDARVQQAVEVLCERIEAHQQGLDAVVDLAVLVAGADGVVDDRELAALVSTVGAVFHSRIRPEVVSVLVRASVATGQREGAAERTRRLAELLRKCDAVDQGLAVARVIERSSVRATREGRDMIDALALALGVDAAGREQGVVASWSLPSARPSTLAQIATEWRKARRARPADDDAAWRADIAELRSIAAALRDSYLGLTTEHVALADLVDQISNELPERRESDR